MTPHSSAESLLIGAHTSTAGGLHHAVQEGAAIGATTIQIFTANQRQWKSRAISKESIEAWKQAREESGIQKIMSHDSYLINLGSPEEDKLKKSQTAFHEEIERCLALELSFLNFHPGSALKDSREGCMDRIIESLKDCASLLPDSSLTLLLETTAGQGSNIGWKFDEIGYILHRVKDSIPIGVCLDTCHSFAAGYDLRQAGGWEEALSAFDEKVGLEYLFAFHLNDSKHDIGSRKDRHANLGDGYIGWEGFAFLMKDPRTRELPKYLETPGGPKVWKEEIAQLRQLAAD